MGPVRDQREQRKVVTVLFADVVGSTSLAAQSDPEVVRSMMSRYFKRIAEIAEAYGGTVEVGRPDRSDSSPSGVRCAGWYLTRLDVSSSLASSWKPGRESSTRLEA
ncbi:MAG: hypothetical protein E6J53_09195 [Chloroflexi bacterium]|nr:MAG: hypothetical protein E6J53_09195 [Chloroflexota bacterium]